MYPHVHCSSIHRSQDIEITCIHLWMNDKDVENIYKEILFSHEKWNLNICNNIDGSWGNFKWSKSKNTNTVWFHLYIESKKTTTTNKKNKSIDTENRMAVVRMEEVWEKGKTDEGDQEVQTYKIKVIKMSYVAWYHHAYCQ